jgi:hypothetical protein
MHNTTTTNIFAAAFTLSHLLANERLHAVLLLPGIVSIRAVANSVDAHSPAWHMYASSAGAGSAGAGRALQQLSPTGISGCCAWPFGHLLSMPGYQLQAIWQQVQNHSGICCQMC